MKEHISVTEEKLQEKLICPICRNRSLNYMGFDQGYDCVTGCPGRQSEEYCEAFNIGVQAATQEAEAEIKALKARLDACKTAGFDIDNPHEHGRHISKDRDAYIAWVSRLEVENKALKGQVSMAQRRLSVLLHMFDDNAKHPIPEHWLGYWDAKQAIYDLRSPARAHDAALRAEGAREAVERALSVLDSQIPTGYRDDFVNGFIHARKLVSESLTNKENSHE
jgi:hypothetical protein